MNENLFAHKGYQGSAQISLEDECLHGKIMLIADLVTYESDTVAGLREVFENAVENYLSQCSEMNVSADVPTKTGNRLRRA